MRISTHARCPACGERGREVSPVTVASLSSLARAELAARDGLRFCRTPSCEVVYYAEASADEESCEILARTTDLEVVVFQKSSDPQRLVCYCFGHSVAAVAADAAPDGASEIAAEITAKCKQGLDRCEETNPQGSCCLGHVRAVAREAASSRGAVLPITSAPAESCCSPSGCCGAE